MIFARSLEMPHTAMPSHSAIHAEFLDFRDKSHGDITVDEISSAISAGRFVWIDLLSSIPVFDSMRWGRAARVVRVLRVIRGIKATRFLASLIFKNRARNAVLAGSFIAVVVIFSCSFAILQFEGAR